MNSTGYLTDQFSTLSGLAGVAYGDVDYFREVQNQILNKSPLSTLNITRPSSNFEAFVFSIERITSLILESIQELYDSNEDIQYYLDIEFGANWKSLLEPSISRVFAQELDGYSAYQLVYSDLFRKAVETVIEDDAIVNDLVVASRAKIERDALLSDFDLVLSSVVNSPQNKITSPPPDSIIDLDNTVSPGKDFKGIDYGVGYLTPTQYFSNLPYPSFTSVYEITTPLLNSVSQGYIGYADAPRLETFLNPTGSESASAPAGLDLSSLYEQVQQVDRDIYDVSLIGVNVNGFLSYDPPNGSNGDFIDRALVNDYNSENRDSSKGALPQARPTTSAF